MQLTKTADLSKEELCSCLFDGRVGGDPFSTSWVWNQQMLLGFPQGRAMKVAAIPGCCFHPAIGIQRDMLSMDIGGSISLSWLIAFDRPLLHDFVQFSFWSHLIQGSELHLVADSFTNYLCIVKRKSSLLPVPCITFIYNILFLAPTPLSFRKNVLTLQPFGLPFPAPHRNCTQQYFHCSNTRDL